MGTTATYAWPYQELTDAPNGASLGQALAAAADTTVAGIDARLAAAEAALAPLVSGVWATWSPTLTNLTIGTAPGAVVARFAQTGKRVDWYWQLLLGTGGAVGTAPTFTLPVAPAAYYNTGGNAAFPGTVHLLQTGATERPGLLKITSGSIVRIDAWNGTPAGVTITATVPFTWVTGNYLTAWGKYEAL